MTSAEARLKVARANLEHSSILLNYATITAPYDGIITRRSCHTGTFVQSAASGTPHPLFTLARVDRLRIVVDLPESEAKRAEIGQAAMFRANGSRDQLPGRIARLADALDSATRTMRIEVELDEPTRTLRPGMFGSVSIVYQE